MSTAPKAAETDTQASAVANTTGVTADSLQATLKEKLGAEHVDIEDMSGTAPRPIPKNFPSPRGFQNSPPQVILIADIASIPPGGCGQMFQALIVSPQFEKKNSLARHRLVNSTLKAEIAAIHAWTPKCFTPEEWEKKKGGS